MIDNPLYILDEADAVLPFLLDDFKAMGAQQNRADDIKARFPHSAGLYLVNNSSHVLHFSQISLVITISRTMTYPKPYQTLHLILFTHASFSTHDWLDMIKDLPATHDSAA